MVKRLALANMVSVLLMIAVNYISQVYRLNNTTIGEVSRTYDNLFTPASYAFAIWGLIFLSLLVFGIFGIRRAFFSEKDSSFLKQTGYWFVLANLLNCCWVLAFVYGHIGLSVIIMLGILFSLLKIVVNTNMERWDAPIGILAFMWWPICLYSGWINVATIANISTYLVKLEWDGAFWGPAKWTMAMIIVATAINFLMVLKKNMREFAAVGIWALVAIYVRQREAHSEIALTALFGTFVLLVTVAVHAYRNRATNPVVKLLQRFKK